MTPQQSPRTTPERPVHPPPPTAATPGDRAQSEVLGNVLLLATVVVAVSVAGAVYLGTVGDDEETLADVAVTPTDDAGVPQVVFVHQGGAEVDDSSLVVRVWLDGTPASPAFNASASTGTADGRFGPGERRIYDVPAMADGDVVRALLATNATNTVLVDDRTTFDA